MDYSSTLIGMSLYSIKSMLYFLTVDTSGSVIMVPNLLGTPARVVRYENMHCKRIVDRLYLSLLLKEAMRNNTTKNATASYILPTCIQRLSCGPWFENAAQDESSDSCALRIVSPGIW
jgi:hypothetical protein